jgi:biotin transport system substrate-specific component
MSASHAGALERRAVLADVIPGARVRDAVLVVSGALLTALFAQISTLGMRRGVASLALYAVLGLFLPFYADGSSGWHVVWGASGGYIIGFIFAAGFIGWMAEHGADRNVFLAFVAFVGGQLLIFAFGLAGLKIAVGESWSWTIHNGLEIFIFGGLVKAAIGAVALPGAWRLVRRFER